ncbi:30S ribosomal protein S4e [Methanohalobium sp.]|uniref:30S ribosomal protein S4e n=1 Tax=Methanohalobium sp. TaxID=2837493 RepID=UPI0025D16EF1|nr:30S ribosomal protein S4e [Methanohalobium sp.]
MGKHQKRISIPNSWRVAKKSNKWVTTTSPGPHHKEQSMPISVILRDMLGLVDNRSEAKRVLSQGKILVDGKPKKDLKFPVGLFDIITIPEMNESYRLLINQKSKLILQKLEESDTNKLCKINDKTMVKSGAIQLNLSDGTNLIGSNDYKAKDSIIITVPDKNIVNHLEYKEGNLAMIVGGKHTGEIGTIKTITKTRSSEDNTVEISGQNYDFETIEDYVVVIGEDKPEINLGELGGETNE